jgi:hypothetical protein
MQLHSLETPETTQWVCQSDNVDDVFVQLCCDEVVSLLFLYVLGHQELMLKLRTRSAIIVRLEGSDRLLRPTPLSVSNGNVGTRKGSIVYMATLHVDKRRKQFT